MPILWVTPTADAIIASGTSRNDPKPPHEYGFDRECAYCAAVIPTSLGTKKLICIGWTQEGDGTWVCPRHDHGPLS